MHSLSMPTPGVATLLPQPCPASCVQLLAMPCEEVLRVATERPMRYGYGDWLALLQVCGGWAGQWVGSGQIRKDRGWAGPLWVAVGLGPL